MRGTIVVVDDDTDSGSLIAEILALRGFVTHSASSGRECLVQLGREPVDVVMTDLCMRGMSGFELCREIRELHPDVLVIALTGDLSRESANEALAAGAYEILHKPATVAVLDVVLLRAISLVRMRREVRGTLAAAGTEETGPPERTIRERSIA